jgi:hypothetical protein
LSAGDLLGKTVYIRNTVITHLDQRAKETSALIKLLLEVEKEPSTRHTHYFKDYRRKLFAFYKGIFNGNVNNDFIGRLQRLRYQSPEFTIAVESIISNLRKIGFHNVQPLELAVLRVSEDSDDAIKIMADVRAYFQGMWPLLAVLEKGLISDTIASGIQAIC